MLQVSSLKNKTVVITGASSGIGHGTALAFAKEGAHIVLAARNEGTLNKVAAECQKFGVHTLVVQTDVTDPFAVQKLAEAAAAAFNGRIDIWVNDAGVGAVGAYEDVPAEAHAQVIAVNLVGYMNGAHAVIPYFKKQKSGTLINMNSLGAWIASPYAASYTASKFGLRGFTEALRAELRNWSDIHVCDVFPSFVRSPGMQHGANYTGVEMKPLPPTVSAHRVAEEIVFLAKNPKPVTMVGLTAKLGRIVAPHAPAFFAGVMASLMERHFKNGKATAITSGNLFSPTPKSTMQVEGSYGGTKKVLATAAVFGGAMAISLLVFKANKTYQPETLRH